MRPAGEKEDTAGYSRMDDECRLGPQQQQPRTRIVERGQVIASQGRDAWIVCASKQGFI